jgi:hypothetical protein
MMAIPSHILINPAALRQALGEAYPDAPALAALADIQAHLERLEAACSAGDPGGARALQAAWYALEVVQGALRCESGAPPGATWKPHHLPNPPRGLSVVVMRPAHQAHPGARIEVVPCGGARWRLADVAGGRRSWPLPAHVICRRLDDWGAKALVDARYQAQSWLELIDCILDRLVGLGWGPEGAAATLGVARAALHGRESPQDLLQAHQASGGGGLTWLDVLEEALVEAEDRLTLGTPASDELIQEVHNLAQDILNGRAPADRLMEAPYGPKETA